MELRDTHALLEFQAASTKKKSLSGEPAANILALPKGDQVYHRIRNLIMHYELKPGQKVFEDEMASLFSISRTPVREALRRLSNEGLITLYPKRYAEVTFFTPEMTKQLGTMRLAQDILAGRLAIYYGSDAEFTQLTALSDICEAAAKAGDLYGRITADRHFHLKITEIAKNEILMKYQREVYLRVHLIQLQNSMHSPAQERISSHAKLIQALMERNEQLFIDEVCQRMARMYQLDEKLVDMYRSRQ